MKITRRSFDIIYSQFNRSILSVTNVRPPTLTQSISPTDLYNLTTSSIKDQTATGMLLVSLTGTLQSDGSGVLGDAKPAAYTNYLRTILTSPLLMFHINAPLLMFHINGYANIFFDVPKNSTAIGFPSELYTTATYADSVGTIMISKWTVIIYLAIGASVYLWCAAVKGLSAGG